MKEFDKLIKDMSKCDKCLNIKNKKQVDCSLINIYDDENFCKKIPSIWTDWYNRLNSDIMIIGQDWGPYIEMKKFNEMYLEDETIDNWRNIINQEKSLTKKNLEKFWFLHKFCGINIYSYRITLRRNIHHQDNHMLVFLKFLFCY